MGNLRPARSNPHLNNMRAIQHFALHYALPGLLLIALTACGGGGNGSDGGGATYTVGGSVSGLTGSGLVLSDNGTDELPIPASGMFSFDTKVSNGAAYAVAVKTQPTNPAQTCLVTNGSGTIGRSNVTNVAVNCTTNTVAGACGIRQATELTSVGPAEGAWGGLFPIFSGVDAIGGSGVVAADGAARFWVGDGEMWIGSVLASSSGAVSSKLIRYERRAGGGPGGPKGPGSPASEALGFDTAAAGATISGMYESALSSCQPLSLAYSDVYLRPASLATAAGVYTVSDGSGYSLTVTIHSDGQLEGSDTLGCVLIGSVDVPDPAVNYYNAVADATTCGSLNGHYVGMLTLSDAAAPNDNSFLRLSLSNSEAAIFHRLTR